MNEKHLTIEGICDPALQHALLDPKLVRIILENLLGNSVKYSPHNKTLHYDLHAASQGVVLEVRDEGPGIPTDAQAHVFTKFFRADNVQMIDPEGTGLGLYIVKSLVEQAGGKISFTSELHHGTTFSVTLPFHSKEKRQGVRETF